MVPNYIRPKIDYVLIMKAEKDPFSHFSFKTLINDIFCRLTVY